MNEPYFDYELDNLSPSAVQHQREMVLGNYLASAISKGWSVESQAPTSATLAGPPPKKVNHILHLLLTLFTGGIWGIVWLILAVTPKGNQERLQVVVDEYGQVQTYRGFGR